MSSGRRAFPTFGQGVLLAIVMVAVQLATGIALAIAMLALKKKLHDNLTQFSTLWGACVSAVIVLVWASSARSEPLRLLFVPKPVAPLPFVLALVATLGGGVVLSEIENWVRWLIPPTPLFRELMTSLGRGSLPLAFLSVAVVAPLCEELIFRGVFLRGFLENYRAWTAILLSSLLFAVVHLNPWQGVSAFGLGMLLSWFVVRTGSLVPAIAGHVMNNAVAVVGLRLSARIPGLTMDGFLPLWLTLLGVFVTAGGILAFHRATRAPRGLNVSTDVAQT